MANETEKINKTFIRKRIGRKIQPKQFESLDISVEAEDEITWSSVDEREKKSGKMTQLVLRDYQETFDQVCVALGLQEKRAFVHGSSKPQSAQPEAKTGEKEPISSSKSDDIFEGLDGV